MGHKRKNPTPSPMRMLAIHAAREGGMSLPDIAKRTKHSVSSIMRWHRQHGDEAQFLQLLFQNYPDLKENLSFDAWYPGEQKQSKSPAEPMQTEASLLNRAEKFAGEIMSGQVIGLPWNK